MSDKQETPKQAWEIFAAQVLPGLGKTEVPQLEQCKISFYVGALSVFSALIEGSQKKLGPAAGGALLESIRADLVAFMKSHRIDIEKVTCPICQMEVGISDLKHPDWRLKPSDAAVCTRCTTFLICGDDMQLRLMTDDEIADLPDQLRNQMLRVRHKIKELSP